MARTEQLVELLVGKDDLRSDGFIRGEWVQNLWYRGDALTSREGFGQFTQLDGTLSATTSTALIGYEKHLGSFAFTTSFGHNQIISLFSGQSVIDNIISSSASIAPGRAARWRKLFYVRIYDVTTDTNYEEIIYTQTQEAEESLDPRGYSLRSLYGNYESTADLDNTKFLAGEDREFFFNLFDGYVYFGNPRVGVYIYRPADFRTAKHQWVESAEENDWYTGYSESSLISKLSLTPGTYSPDFRYLKTSEMGEISDVTQTSTGRTVWASGRELYFSDPYSSASLIATNYVTIPLENPITAIHALRTSILVFSKTELYLYQPNVGAALASTGRVIKISESIGCISPNTIRDIKTGAVWVSYTGVHVTENGSSIQTISDGIHNFFAGGSGDVTNPMTSFFETILATPGMPQTGEDHPRTLICSQKEGVCIAYEEQTETVLISFPDINSIWVFRDGWTFWPVESCVSVTAGAPVVGSQKNLTNPWVTTLDGEIYLTIGTEAQAFEDNTTGNVVDGVVSSHEVTTGSYALLRMGLGGALDRSTADEDHRIGSQQYFDSLSGPTLDGIYYIREPVYDEADSSYWVPVEAVRSSDATNGVIKYSVFFKFDATQWTPRVTAFTNLHLKFDSERIYSGSAVTGTRTNNLKVADAAGSYLLITYDGTTLPVGFQEMNISARGMNPLFWFNMTAISDNAKTGFAITPITADCTMESAGTAVVKNCAMKVFGQTVFKSTDLNFNDKKAQPVDWSFQSSSVSQPAVQLQARGLFASILSRGKGDVASGTISNGWLWGVYNVLLGSDAKPFSSQIVDISTDEIVPNISRVLDKTSIRNRMKDSTGAMAQRTFNNAAKWGEIGNPTHGNFLIDDQQHDTIAISDSVKGHSLRYMIFGFFRGRAERFTIQSLLANLRPSGSRRRIGR